MIDIYANNIKHTVNIKKGFNPVYTPAIKFITAMNGVTTASDRGETADKYDVTFTVIGDTADIESLANDIYLEDNQVLLDSGDLRLFGQGIDHSLPYTCNVMNDPISYPMRDRITSTLTLKLRLLTAPIYDSSVSTSLPTILYSFPVYRKIDTFKSPWDSIARGDYGNSVRTGGSSVIKSEIVTIQTRMKNSEFAQLHRFVANTRASTFQLDTNTCLELFLNSISTNVKIVKFSYAPDGIGFWKANLTLVNNV